MKKIIMLYLFMVIALFSIVNACSCLQFDVETSYNFSDIVFTGKVISLKENSNPSKNNEVKFEIYNVLKGQEMRELELETPVDSAACGYNFAKDEEYIVYAQYVKEDSFFNNDDMNLVSSLCSGNKLLLDAQEDIDDIMKIKELKNSSNTWMIEDLEVSIVFNDTINYNLTLLLPTPCHNYTSITNILESYPLQVTLEYNIIEPPQDVICMQVIKEEKITGSISTDGPIGTFTILIDGNKRAEYVSNISISEGNDANDDRKEDFSLWERLVNWFKNIF